MTPQTSETPGRASQGSQVKPNHASKSLPESSTRVKGLWDSQSDFSEDFSEDALATRFVDVYREKIRFSLGQWYWRRSRDAEWSYPPDFDAIYMTALARRFCRWEASNGDLSAAERRRIQSLRTIRNILQLAKSDPRVWGGVQ
jgi:hypothetical protein